MQFGIRYAITEKGYKLLEELSPYTNVFYDSVSFEILEVLGQNRAGLTYNELRRELPYNFWFHLDDLIKAGLVEVKYEE